MMLRCLTRSLSALCLLAVTGTLAARAEDCAGTHQVDRCLVGTWKMTTNGMERWMREHVHKFNVTSVSQTGNTITLNADGTFTTGASNVTVQGAGGGATGTGHMAAQASGHWSAANGNFNICAASTSSMNGTATVQQNGHTVTVPVRPTMPPVSSRAYTCAGNTFTVTTPMRAGSVESIYTKIPAP
jgi:hypothetical protein